MTNGVVLLLSSSFMFALLYYYPAWLVPLDGEQIFGWRMLFTLPGVSLYLWLSGEWRLVVSLFQELKKRPLLWIGLPLSASLVGVQLWLFMWAPVNGGNRCPDRGCESGLADRCGILGNLCGGDRLSALLSAASLAGE